MDDEQLKELLTMAQLNAPCRVAQCRVSAEVHHFYVDVVHLDPDANTYDCPTGELSHGYPRHTISTHTLFETRREVLVSTLAAWLTSLHQHFVPLTDGGGSPVDADPGASASFDSSRSADGAGADPICWDCVGSVPSD